MPSAPEPIKVVLWTSSASRGTEGIAYVTKLTGREAFVRGGKLALKYSLTLVGFTLPFVIVEPFLAQIWGSVMLFSVFLVIGPYLHLRIMSERSTFSHVDGPCPACGGSQVLKPFLSAQYKPSFTVLCPACGQTCTAEAAG